MTDGNGGNDTRGRPWGTVIFISLIVVACGVLALVGWRLGWLPPERKAAPDQEQSPEVRVVTETVEIRVPVTVTVQVEVTPPATGTAEPESDERSESGENSSSSEMTTSELTRCPEDGEMQEVFGFHDIYPVFTGEAVRWDSCKWNWQMYANSDEGITFTLPANWQATVTKVGGRVEVWRGPAEVGDVVGFTLRYVPAYAHDHWIHDDCRLLSQEHAFGQRRVPSYQTVPGNVECEGFDPRSDVCPTTEVEVAALIGGDALNWTAPDWELGAWTFKASQDEYIGLKVPETLADAQEIVRLDYWDGEAGAPATLLPGNEGLALNEASFHCHAAEE